MSQGLWLALSLVVGTLLDSTVAQLYCVCTDEACQTDKVYSLTCEADPNKGCYKQYVPQGSPHIVMGCVSSRLLCDVPRPERFPAENWLVTKCCTNENNCNQHLQVEDRNSTPSTTSTQVTEKPTATTLVFKHDVTRKHINRRKNIDSRTSKIKEDEEGLHPVFVLLIVLALVFLVVVVASISVIVRIWFYRKQKSKQINPWSCQLLHRQQKRLLPPSQQHDESLKSDTTSSSTSTSGFDVP